MNSAILLQYGLKMRKINEPFDGFIKGPLEAYLYIYRHPEDVPDFIDDIQLAIDGNFTQIEDPDWGASLTSRMEEYWYALITPTHFEIRQYPALYESRQIIPLEDWKEILLSWKECIK